VSISLHNKDTENETSDKTMVLLSTNWQSVLQHCRCNKTVRPEEIKELKKIIQKNGCLSKTL
jgi:predicted transcriptional regulator